MITSFLTILNQLQVFHWQTHSYAQHKAFVKTYENLYDLFDKFVETFYGKYGTPTSSHEYLVESMSYITFDSDREMIEYITSLFEKTKENIESILDSATDGELINIYEEIKAEFHRLKYLLLLK